MKIDHDLRQSCENFSKKKKEKKHKMKSPKAKEPRTPSPASRKRSGLRNYLEFPLYEGHSKNT